MTPPLYLAPIREIKNTDDFEKDKPTYFKSEGVVYRHFQEKERIMEQRSCWVGFHVMASCVDQVTVFCWCSLMPT